MKCRHRESLFSILVIVFITSVWGKSTAIKCENSLTINRVSPNTVQSINSFPNEDCTKLSHHRIVKKQMRISISDQDDRNNSVEGDRYFFAAANLHKKAKFQNKKIDEALIPCESTKLNRRSPIIKKFGKKRAYATAKGIFKWRRKRSLNIETKAKRENKFLSGQTQNEVHEQGREMCKKIPNKRTIELQKDKFKQYNFKRFPVNKKFSEAFEELMKSSISKVPGRVKKWNLNLKKTPFPSSEGDTEPTNEWLDASQSAGSKIPTEFKPKPKMKLKIYHLRCKKKSNENPWGKKIKKRCALYKSLGYDNFGKAIHISKDEEPLLEHNLHRHHPRSFVVRRNEKPKEKNESSEEEEYDEDDEEDEYEELEEEADQNHGNRKGSQKAEEKLYSKEGLRDLFKSAKEALVSKVKSNEPSIPQFVGKINYNVKETESPCDEDKSNKVLIDANIKVDEEISSAFRNILSKGKEKIMKD